MTKSSHTSDATLPADLVPVLQSKVRPPVCIVLGSPRQAVELVQALPLEQPILYQMDLYQTERIQELLAERSLTATVTTCPDLWDLSDRFRTIVYPVEPQGERELKLDMIEQGYHLLESNGSTLVLSRRDNDQFFPQALKKIYGRVHAPECGPSTVLWCRRGRDRPRRRHQVTFQVNRSNGEGQATSLRFVSRPGVFSYGRFDNGARALMEIAEIREGDAILDFGCGSGTNGVIGGLRSGPSGHVTFIDSNCRATELARFNATANGLTNFDALTCCRLDNFAPRSFDVVLANPPYFANLGIAQRFIEQSRPLLRKGGRFYLVTKMPTQVGPMMAAHFGQTLATERRGYVVLSATPA